MMIHGIGVDVAEVDRFEAKPYQRYRAFYEKIFTKAEIKYCLDYTNPYPHFAARFAAKEAAVKALGAYMNLKDIEVYRADKAPQLRIAKLKNVTSRISLSHTKKIAVAFVILIQERS